MGVSNVTSLLLRSQVLYPALGTSWTVKTQALVIRNKKMSSTKLFLIHFIE